MAIDFTLSDSQQELQKNAKAFAEGVLRPVAGRIDRAADGWESFLGQERVPPIHRGVPYRPRGGRG